MNEQIAPRYDTDLERTKTESHSLKMSFLYPEKHYRGISLEMEKWMKIIIIVGTWEEKEDIITLKSTSTVLEEIDRKRKNSMKNSADNTLNWLSSKYLKPLMVSISKRYINQHLSKKENLWRELKTHKIYL